MGQTCRHKGAAVFRAVLEDVGVELEIPWITQG